MLLSEGFASLRAAFIPPLAKAVGLPERGLCDEREPSLHQTWLYANLDLGSLGIWVGCLFEVEPLTPPQNALPQNI